MPQTQTMEEKACMPNSEEKKADKICGTFGMPKISNDPWAHRSARMKCTTCMWFVEKVGRQIGLGRCRRHCPTMNGYPVVFTTDWCGDHKIDKNKI